MDNISKEDIGKERKDVLSILFSFMSLMITVIDDSLCEDVLGHRRTGSPLVISQIYLGEEVRLRLLKISVEFYV